MNKIVSILMATYNGEVYLQQQLDSIMSQSYKDWILYISDDGSSDRTIDIINSYIESYPSKIKLYKDHEPNKSSCKNFLFLLDKVDSDLYLFCDQDDVWTSNHIEELIKGYESLREDERLKPVVVHSDLKVVDEELNIIGESFFSYSLMKPHLVKKNSYYIENNVTGGVMLINKILKEYVFKNKELLQSYLDSIPMHDHLLALIANKYGRIVYVNKCLEFYRQHNHNVAGATKVRSLRHLCKKFMTLDTKWYQSSRKFVEYFKACYAELDSPDNINKMDAYCNLYKMNKISAIRFLHKNQFVKENRARRILQYLSVLKGLSI